MAPIPVAVNGSRDCEKEAARLQFHNPLWLQVRTALPDNWRCRLAPQWMFGGGTTV